MKKLIIGTAQLVKNYGITNFKNKKNKKKIFQFLEFCIQNSIYNYDTAANYGSEKIIGEFIKINNLKNLKIYSKIPSLKFVKDDHKLDYLKKKIDLSIENFYSLDTIYFHDENDLNFFKKNLFKIDYIIKSYKIKNLGFSIYSKNLLKDLLSFKEINTIQLPFNIIDKHPNNIKSNKTIIARSIFLQGLLINSKLKTKNFILKKFNERLMKLSIKNDMDIYSLCLDYVLEKNFINKIVVGFDDVVQLKKILKFKKGNINTNHLKLINSLISKTNYDIIKDPRKW